MITDGCLKDEAMQVGSPADAVRDVIRLDTAEIGPPPEIGINIDTEFIQGAAKQDDAFLVIINVDKVIAAVYADFCQE